ncbi:MAG: hypothetical protein ACHQ4H_06920 [Ktedonobacterales bacterium]
MMRKDALGTEERPHFYSKFWVEVAKGETGVATHYAETAIPETDSDDFDSFEDEIELPRPAPKAKPKAEKKPEPARPVLTSLADLANIEKLMQDSAAMDTEEIPDIESGAIDDFAPFGQAVPAADIAVDVADGAVLADETPQDEDEEFGDVFDEDEEEDEWGANRRPQKKQPNKPKRERPRF